MGAPDTEYRKQTDRVARESDYHERVFRESSRLQRRFSHVFLCPNATHAEGIHWASIRSAASGKIVLDYGCAEGGFEEKLIACAPRAVYGIDLSEKAIDIARSKNLPRTTFVTGDAHHLPWPDGSFDVIVGRAILHHLDLDTAIGELLRVLRPDGKMFFVEPLYHNPLVGMFRWLTPGARTIDEKPLTRSDVRRIDYEFEIHNHEYSLLVSMVAGAFTSLIPGIGPTNWLLRGSDRVDRMLAHTPLRWWMGHIYLRLENARSTLLDVH
jgi:SAM-dependent methyltransferase